MAHCALRHMRPSIGYIQFPHLKNTSYFYTRKPGIARIVGSNSSTEKLGWMFSVMNVIVMT